MESISIFGVVVLDAEQVPAYDVLGARFVGDSTSLPKQTPLRVASAPAF